MTPRRGALAGMFLASLLLTACGTTSEAAGPAESKPGGAADASAGHNAADVMYLQMMVAQHRQGLEMVRLAADRSRRKEVKRLAAAVETTQTDELRRMTSWLKAWSKPATLDGPPPAHAFHGARPATGAKEIEALKQTEGARFETAFLNLFIGHQHNAVEMSRREMKEGADPATKAFAERVTQSRTGQIKLMLGLLNG